ncbi:MAG: methionine--tRNA ligase subunit beta [bacterium]
MISIEDYAKIEIRIGKILKAEIITDADKLLRLEVDFGEEKPRQIVSGIRSYYPELEKLVGTKCAFLANLEPRVIRGHESQGMILAASTDGGMFSLLKVSDDIPPGTKIK